MSIAEDLSIAISRILDGCGNDSDILTLRKLLGSAVASGKRSVAINGDVTGATITTGDGNRILNVVFQADGIRFNGEQYHGDGAEILRSLLYEILTPTVDINWPKISQKLLEPHLHLTTNPITHREDISYEVEHVYVPLGLVERKKIPRIKADVLPERGSELYREVRKKNKDSELIDEVEVTQKFEHDEFIEQVIRLQKSPKSQGKRLAIVGEPGAGKTTILQQIARWLTTYSPNSVVIWISLADFQENGLETYLEEQWLKNIVREAGGAEILSAYKQDFATQLQQTQVWLILDGLDEMRTDESPLSDIQRQIHQGRWIQKMRIITTCRLNLWDSNRNALTDFDTYFTLDFSYPEQVEKFISQWFLPRKKGELGKALCTALRESGKERIRDLVKNPLRLTLLCFSWFLRQGKLPQTQAELYQRFTEQVYEWKCEVFPITSNQRKELDQALARMSIAAIDSEGSRFRLTQDFVYSFLDKTLPEEQKTLLNLAIEIGWLNKVGVDADNPELDIYAFYHTTFQEYFAALGIDDWHFFLNHVSGNSRAKELSYRVFEAKWRQVFLLWIGRKNESLVPEKEALINALLKFKDNCGGFYSNQAFLLAAIGISEYQDCCYSNEIINQYVNWRFGHSNLRFSFTSIVKQAWLRLVSPGKIEVMRYCCDVNLRYINSQRAISKLENILKPCLTLQYPITKKIFEDIKKDLYIFPDNLYTYQEISEVLGKLDSGNQVAARALIRLADLFWDSNSFTLSRASETAIKILGGLHVDHKLVVESLIKILEKAHKKRLKLVENDIKHTELADQLSRKLQYHLPFARPIFMMLDKIYRFFLPSSKHKLTFIIQNSLESLGKIGKHNEEVAKTLAWIAVTTQDSLTCWKAIESLEKIDVRNTVTTNSLLQIIETKHDQLTFHGAITCLGQIGVKDENAVTVLIHLIEDNQDPDTQIRAINSLRRVGSGSEIEIQTLLSLMKTAQDSSVFACAAANLKEIGFEQMTAIQGLLEIIENFPDIYHYHNAASCLGAIAKKNEIAIQKLTELVEFIEDDNLLWHVAYTLGEIDPGNETAVRLLTEIVETTTYYYAWSGAAYSLSKLLPKNQVSVPALTSILETIPKDLEKLRLIAVHYLHEIEPKHSLVLQTLEEIVNAPQDEDNLMDAIETLHNISPNNEALIKQLVVQIKRFSELKTWNYPRDRNESIELYRHEKLKKILFFIGIGNETAIQGLVKALETSQEWRVKRDLLEVLSIIGAGNEIAIHVVIEYIFNYKYTLPTEHFNNLAKIIIDNAATKQALMDFFRDKNLRVKMSLRNDKLYEIAMKSSELISYSEFTSVFNYMPVPFWICQTINIILDLARNEL